MHDLMLAVPPSRRARPWRRCDSGEIFTVLAGEIEATFRGKRTVVRAGETLHIPANAPHSFTNASN